GGFTPSAAASDLRLCGPPNTSTDSADKRGGLIPVSASAAFTPRSRPIAARCSASASGSGFEGIRVDMFVRLTNYIALSSVVGQGPGLKAIPQVAIASSDPDKLAAYYRDVLGLAVQFEASGMTFFGAGAVRLMIGPAQGAKPGDKILYFEPEDFAAAEASLE